MCLAAWCIGEHPRFTWVLAANRDEFFDRPAAPLAWWRPAGARDDVLSGRDLEQGGIWLGLTRTGRFALVTNVREGLAPRAGVISRGAITLAALTAAAMPADIEPAWRDRCAGFNLVVGDLRSDAFTWMSNRAAAPLSRAHGKHGLSNAALDTPWPKLRKLSSQMQDALTGAPPLDELREHLLRALRDPEPALDAELPDTGVGLARERVLSSAFIRSGGHGADARPYGTRCSTVLVVERVAQEFHVHVFERSYEFDAQRYRDVMIDLVVQ